MAGEETAAATASPAREVKMANFIFFDAMV